MRERVELLSGEMEMISEINNGTRFIFKIPLNHEQKN